MAVIDLKVKDLYPVLKPTVVKIESEGVLNPQTANRIGYEFLHDVKAVRDAHNNKSVPPFAIKKLQRNSFELHIMIPVSETALYIHAERMGVKIYSIEYPKFNIPSVYNVEGVDIIFTSPTSFRWDQKHIPYFESLLFWRSCLKLWSLFTGHKIEEQDRMVNVLAAEVYTVFTDLIFIKVFVFGKSFQQKRQHVDLVAHKIHPPSYSSHSSSISSRILFLRSAVAFLSISISSTSPSFAPGGTRERGRLAVNLSSISTTA